MSEHIEENGLAGQFLVAMPGMVDPNFNQTVTYVCAHNDQGAMGIIINRPLDLLLDDVLSQMDLKSANKSIGRQRVYLGGPVQTERGLVLHRPDRSEWESSIKISNDVEITTSRDILQAIAKGQGPEDSMIALGYAGWGAGQLEQELVENAWLSAPCDISLIFRAPAAQRWQLAIELLGLDCSKLSSQVGHA